MLANENNEVPAKKATVSLEKSDNLNLSSFSNSNTQEFLKKLKIQDSFLHLPVAQWEENQDYKAAKKFCHSLAVVNDHAERSVSLVQTYSGRLTTTIYFTSRFRASQEISSNAQIHLNWATMSG